MRFLLHLGTRLCHLLLITIAFSTIAELSTMIELLRTVMCGPNAWMAHTSKDTTGCAAPALNF